MREFACLAVSHYTDEIFVCEAESGSQIKHGQMCSIFYSV